MGSQAAIDKVESELLSVVAHTKAAKERRQRHIKRGLVALLGGAAVIALGAFSTHYWTTGRFLVDTDDAYVAADSTAVAPKVSGYIKDVLVTDNQAVHAGQVLARIDDSDFQTALQQAGAAVESARADIASLEAQIEQQRQTVTAARSNITSDEALQKLAEQDHQRYSDLLHTGYGTVQRMQQAEAATRQANASVQRDQANLAAALKETDVLRAQLTKAKAVLAQDEAAAAQARLNVSYTTITAAIDGAVGARSLRVGSYVQAGTQLMQIVPLHDVYVTANFKETQLANVRAGQAVILRVDSLPGVEIAGTVDSLAPASGQQFALLPPDNATGNFTKIVQRIPVKIALDQSSATAGRLRPGMSVEAVVDTKPALSSHSLAMR